MNILITGGASGLGNAITRRLAKDPGNRVYFTYNNSLSNAQLLEKEFKNTTAIKCDFKIAAELDALINSIEALKINVLINNAYSGTPIKTYFHKMAEADFETEFMFNTMPAIRLTQASIKIFRKNKSGRIITILTSFLVNTPPIGSSAYVANKAFLASLVKSWAVENVKFNISSNSVSPSFMQTNLSTEVDERVIEQMVDNHPLKKLLTVEEAADAVAFLVHSSIQINGVDILLNAGINIK